MKANVEKRAEWELMDLSEIKESRGHLAGLEDQDCPGEKGLL